MKIERMEAFSDGVFAILITILVLEFTVPACREGTLKTAVLQQWPQLAAYLMTFTYIGVLWLFHNDLFQEVTQTDARLNVLNLLSLFLTTLLSYSMSLLSSSLVTMNTDDLRFAVMLYALIALGISLSYDLLYSYLYRNKQLLKSTELSSRFRSQRRYPLLSIAVYLCSLLSAIRQVRVGLAFLLLGIIFHYIAYWRVGSSAARKDGQAKE